MKKLLAFTVVSAFFLPSPSMGAETAIGTGTVKAEIIARISIIENRPMNFGKIISSAVGGTVALAHNGTITTTLNHKPGTQQQGLFTIGGQANTPVTISFPPSVTISNGSSTMTVDNFVHNAGPTPLIGGGGETTLRAGATLNVGNSQPKGVYTGTYTLIVNY